MRVVQDLRSLLQLLHRLLIVWACEDPLIGLTDPKDVEKMIQDTGAELDHSHRRNLAAMDKLMTPLQQYVDQGDLAPQLALKVEECNKLHLSLKH